MLPSMIAQHLEDGKSEIAEIFATQLWKIMGEYERKFRELGMR